MDPLPDTPRRGPRTRLQDSEARLKLMHLPRDVLQAIIEAAGEGAPWAERSRLAAVCRTFREIFHAHAFTGRTLSLNLNTLSWRLAERKRRAATRAELLAALGRVAPSVQRLALRYQMDPAAGLSLEALLAPLAPHVRSLSCEDSLALGLLRSLGSGAWASLEDVELVGCNPWLDFEGSALVQLERLLGAMPEACAKIRKFECSCQGMPAGGEAFFRHLPALRCLEMEDWAGGGWGDGAARDYGPLRAMSQLSRLTLNIVEDLDDNLPQLASLTQLKELLLIGCYCASRGLSQLTCLSMLDLQPGMEDEGIDGEAAAAWKCSSLTELRWCGDLVFDDGPAPIALPNLVSLEIDEAFMPPDGFPVALCDALTQLSSLRLVGGRCTRLPPDISKLQRLACLALDSCQLPAIPPSISCLTAVTNLQLANMSLKPHLPPWVLGMPVRRLWCANNQLTALLPPKAPRTTAAAHEARSREWLGRLTHVCLSSNALRELPTPLLEHATALEELDLAYNHTLQIGAKAAAAVAKLGSLRLLRIEKSYWLTLSDRWTQASLRSIARLQSECPRLRVEFEHKPASLDHLRLAW